MAVNPPNMVVCIVPLPLHVGAKRQSCILMNKERLTPAVTNRRPTETFQVHSKPQAGAGHMHGAG